MDKTTLKQLKPGTLFRLKDSESSPVWVYILDQTEEEGRRICIQNIIERNINQENQDENETI